MNQCAIIHAKEQVIKFLYKSPMFKHKTSTLSKVLYFFALLTISSCAPSRNLVYFSDLKNTADYTEDIKNKIEPKIQSDDLLSISVSSLNPESNLLFNSGVMQTAGSGGGTGASTKVNEGYLVSNSGAINFPVLGNINLAGLTKEEATEKMTLLIKNHVKNPIVNIRFLNFRITVIGEVNRPSTFTIPTERINLIEALGLAGDMTSYGKRENVLIIKEKDGIRKAVRVNMTKKDVMNSPYFYLQQNDVVYVEPIKIKSLQGGAGNFYLTLATASVSILSLIIVFFK